MCGIAGIIGNSASDSTAQVKQMLSCIEHRGPNDSGQWSADGVELGHMRLSIIDTSSAGHQPMLSHDGRYVLVFNGEIYNYIEIRAELEAKGATFTTQTDSEVLIEAYRHYGPDFLQYCNGMFAFAIWDTQEKTLFAARDRVGIKPFFYRWQNGVLQFASEMKSLLTVQKSDPNWQYYYHFFDRTTPLGCDETVFTDIKHLRPGHTLTIKNGTLDIRRYWSADPAFSRRTFDYSHPVETVRELVDASIKLRLRSDVPIGICLSGGVDSSVIAMSLYNQGVVPTTFSSVYDEPECNESQFIDAVNQATGAESHRITPRSEDFFVVMEQIVHHHDEPVRMPGTYSHWHVMKCAHDHVTVLLDGQGGDEVFGGYSTYYSSYIASLLRDMLLARQPLDAWQQIRDCCEGMNKYMGGASPFVKEAVARLLPASLRSLAATKTAKDAFFKPDFVAAYGRDLLPAVDEQRIQQSFPSILDREMYTTFSETNLPMLLRYEDRNSMAFSLEARVPLLDYTVVEYVNGLSYRNKMHGYDTKWVLREAYKDLLPKVVQERKDKKGFPTPTAHWFRGLLAAELRDRLTSEQFNSLGVFDPQTVKQMLDQHSAGTHNHERTLFRMLTLSMWAGQFHA